jgi:hypothetical protein
MNFINQYPTDDYVLKFLVGMDSHGCGRVEYEWDDYPVTKFFTAYFPYPFPDIVKYKRHKYHKTHKRQQDNVFFKFPKEVVCHILKQLGFSDMKSMALACVDFYKLISGPIGEMALRDRFINLRVVMMLNGQLGFNSDDIYPPISCKNPRFWWCKTKNIITFNNFTMRLLKDYSKFKGGKYINFRNRSKIEHKKYLRDYDDISFIKNKRLKKSDYIEDMISRVKKLVDHDDFNYRDINCRSDHCYYCDDDDYW